jgi:hypothetical protein
VTTGGVILIARFALLSPNVAERFSSNRPSPNTGANDIEQAERATINKRLLGLMCTASIIILSII